MDILSYIFQNENLKEFRLNISWYIYFTLVLDYIPTTVYFQLFSKYLLGNNENKHLFILRVESLPWAWNSVCKKRRCPFSLLPPQM